VADVDLQVSVDTLTQTANTTAIGSFSLFGYGGDVIATTVQIRSISDNDFMAS